MAIQGVDFLFIAYTILVIRVGRDYLVRYPYNEYKIRAKYINI